MKILLNIFILIFLSIIQVSVIPHLSVYGGMPNLVLAGSIMLIFLESDTWALFWALIGGLILDLFSGGVFGIYTLGFLGIVWFLIYLNKRLIESTNLFLIVFLTLASSIVFDFWFLTISWAMGRISSVLIYSQIIGADAFMNALLIMIIFPFIFGFWRNYFHGSEIKL